MQQLEVLYRSGDVVDAENGGGGDVLPEVLREKRERGGVRGGEERETRSERGRRETERGGVRGGVEDRWCWREERNREEDRWEEGEEEAQILQTETRERD